MDGSSLFGDLHVEKVWEPLSKGVLVLTNVVIGKPSFRFKGGWQNSHLLTSYLVCPDIIVRISFKMFLVCPCIVCSVTKQSILTSALYYQEYEL